MNIHAKFHSVFVVIPFVFGATLAHATVHPTATMVSAVQSTISQAGASTDLSARRQALDQLAIARKAMSENKFKLAEQYLTKVENSGVSFDSPAAKQFDTPAKLRRELEQRQANTRPSNANQRTAYLPLKSGSSRPSGPPTTDPFMSRNLAAQQQANTAPTRPPSSNNNDFELGPAKSDKSFDRLPFGPPTSSHEPRKTFENAANSANHRPITPQQDPKMRGLKNQALRLTSEANFALDRGDLELAKKKIREAVSLKVPNSAFAPNDPRPWDTMLRIEAAAKRRGNGVVPANYIDGGPGATAKRADFDSSRDQSRNRQVQNEEPKTPAKPAKPATPAAGGSEAQRLFELGMRALEERNPNTARTHFLQAWKNRDKLDPQTRQILQDKLTALAPKREPLPPAKSPLDEVDREQQLIVEKLKQEIFRERAAAEKLIETDPRAALEKLNQLRDKVSQAQIAPNVRQYLVTLVDRRIVDTERYIKAHAGEIEVSETNRANLAAVEQRRQQKIEIENKLAGLVEKFNELMDEQRIPEAEVIARQARELAPQHAVVQTMYWKSKFARRMQELTAFKEKKEDAFLYAIDRVHDSSMPYDDGKPIQFGDRISWERLSRNRAEWKREFERRLSPAEVKIQQSLIEEKVEARFTNRPLREVLDILGATAGVNIHLDQRGLVAEGRTSDEPITLVLNQPISLRSALNLILDPLQLSYVVQNEVIKVTSEQLRDEHTYPKTYYVADLVIPIPNFVPSYNIGLPGAIAAAHNAMGYGGGFAPSGSVPFSVAANSDVTNPVTNNPQVLANMGPDSYMGAARSQRPMGYGPGGLGGAAAADFDSLIELITTTVSPESWDEVGGPGSISGFETNLSLVVSQTQEVHEQLAELLTQLRRLQDLQVTIEVRFITLNDNFFERIGIDFDFEIDDNSGLVGDGMGGIMNPPPDDGKPFTLFGLDATGNPTGDLDVVFSQDSFGSAVPQFGGFDAATAANVGFAILSDIEVFFLLQASLGDTRSNVMQAPKVTLFNGQTALVSDTSQRPFVTSVIPVVGDFAAAHQPVIVVLSEGTSLSVQAVVTSDRRFVRLTLVPFFSSIGNVQEFTFTGKKVSQSVTNTTDNIGALTGATDTSAEVTEGTTVQLPTFNFTTVTTTVSVPDGGTVLMGGIKRLSEGRNERGVPLISKLPYISRLFKNVSIGRQAQSLMMMVTPRIIIQEEEELDQTGLDSSRL